MIKISTWRRGIWGHTNNRTWINIFYCRGQRTSWQNPIRIIWFQLRNQTMIDPLKWSAVSSCQDWEKTISGKDISTNFQGLPSYHEKQFVVLPSWHVSCKSLVGLGTCLVGKSAVMICRLVGSNELQQFCRFFILRSPICRWKNSLHVGIYFLWKKQHIDCFKWLIKSYAFYCYVWYLANAL